MRQDGNCRDNANMNVLLRKPNLISLWAAPSGCSSLGLGIKLTRGRNLSITGWRNSLPLNVKDLSDKSKMSKQQFKRSKQEEESSEEDQSEDDQASSKQAQDQLEESDTLQPAKERDDLAVITLSSKKFAKVRKFAGKTYVDFREYYEKDGKMLPGKKGLMLNKAEWQNIKRNLAAIDNAFSKVE